MAPLYLILLSALDIILYTARSYTSKLYADSCHEEPIQATLVFSAITGFVGYFLTILFSGGAKVITFGYYPVLWGFCRDGLVFI